MSYMQKYQIYQDVDTLKFGIRDTNMDITVVKCIFDNIEFYESSGLIRFTLNSMQAVYNIDEIPKLSY